MTGSVDEAEDLVQETFLRAWRSRASFEGRAQLSTWLHRIATNVCLDALAQRAARVLPQDVVRAVAPDDEPRATPPLAPELPWLQPFPDRLLDPESLAASRESIELAFLAALQHLPPRQRAILILCDVLGWSAKEVAELLELSVAAVTSALQRAHATMRTLVPTGLIQRVGGTAAVFGFSSGAALALAAAAHGLAITRLALFDLPLTVERAANPVDHAAALDALVRAGRRGDAVEYFQIRMVGLPEPLVVQLRGAPFRAELEAIAHTLVYDATIIGDGSLPIERARNVRIPTLAIAAGKGPPFMRETAEALARAMPDCRALLLEHATHDLVPEVLAPPLIEFFSAGPRA